MKRERVGKHFALAFGLALLLYFGAFWMVEFLRTRKGGWEISFQSDSQGRPSLQVAQAYLAITNVLLKFPSSRFDPVNFRQTIRFDQPLTNVPFGKVIYLDTTFLPGAIVIDLFGHEVQLLPRVLMVDHREIPWQSEMILPLPEAVEPAKILLRPNDRLK